MLYSHNLKKSPPTYARTLLFKAFITSQAFVGVAFGDPVWVTSVTPTHLGTGSSPIAACEDGWYWYGVWGNGSWAYKDVYLTSDGDQTFKCWATVIEVPTGRTHSTYEFTSLLQAPNCDEGTYDPESGVCRPSGLAKQKGTPLSKVCSLAGDPINFLIGNSVQSEVDYRSAGQDPLIFARTYNSIDGFWRNNYSTHLRIEENIATVIMNDGRETSFTVSNKIATPDSSSTGSLNWNNTQWSYQDTDGESYSFDSSGRLTTWNTPNGHNYHLDYFTDINSGIDHTTVTDNRGHTLTFTEYAFHQPRNLITPSSNLNYTYNNQALTSVKKTENNLTSFRNYEYLSHEGTSLLTSIIDERGIRSASWTFDSEGRAVSSKQAGAAGTVVINYGSDAATVTNELGKVTTYSFTTFNGVRKITSIQGEPTPSCAASNSSYTYNESGQILTKTDAQGYITTYTYNDRGLETSRTEASGTPLARTTTTEWDPTRFLPTKVVTPTQTTLYTYDDQGRQLSQQTTMTSTN